MAHAALDEFLSSGRLAHSKMPHHSVTAPAAIRA